MSRLLFLLVLWLFSLWVRRNGVSGLRCISSILWYYFFLLYFVYNLGKCHYVGFHANVTLSGSPIGRSFDIIASLPYSLALFVFAVLHSLIDGYQMTSHKVFREITWNQWCYAKKTRTTLYENGHGEKEKFWQTVFNLDVLLLDLLVQYHYWIRVVVLKM